MLWQLQTWTGVGIRNAPSVMGFSESAKSAVAGGTINYIFPLYEETIGNRIIIYGAGVVGKSYFLQLRKREDICVSLWVDKEYKKYHEEGYPVEGCFKMTDVAYDYVVLAVKASDVAKQIRSELLTKGVAKDKIIWKPPIALIC